MEKLHNHPSMEMELGIDKDHVIIDRNTYDRLLKREQEESKPSNLVIRNKIVLTIDRNESNYEVFLGDKKSNMRFVRFTNAQASCKEHFDEKIIPKKLREEMTNSFHAFNLMQLLNKY